MNQMLYFYKGEEKKIEELMYITGKGRIYCKNLVLNNKHDSVEELVEKALL